MQNVSIFYFAKGAAKKKQTFFIFIKDRYFVPGGPTDVNVDLFLENSVGFLKSVVRKFSRNLPKVMPV